MTHYMAIDQYGQAYHGLKYPRRDLCAQIGVKHAAKIYIDDNDGKSFHTGYIIGGLWLTIYEVTEYRKAA